MKHSERKVLYGSVRLLSAIITLIAFSLMSTILAADPIEPSRAIPQSVWSMAHLYDIVIKEPQLNENDIDYYIKELPQILALKADPSQIPKIIAATGWSENRLAYVATKMGTGLITLLEPEESFKYRFPFFTHPTPAEAELIKAREKDIQQAFMRIIDSETPKPAKTPKRQSKKPKA
jgi:hypothetical protein